VILKIIFNYIINYIICLSILMLFPASNCYNVWNIKPQIGGLCLSWR